jgi:hypothetical protein
MSWGKLSLSGGPAGSTVVAKLNGEQLVGAHRIEITADVRDVVKVKTFTYVEARVELDVESVEQGYLVDVREGSINANKIMVFGKLTEGRGKTVVEALRDAADILERTEAAERLA